MAHDTGNGATVAFTTGSFTARVTSVELGSKSREALDQSGIDTTVDAEMLPGDLWRHDPVTVNYLVDVTNSAKYAPPEAVDTLTITFANQGANTNTRATLAGSGFVTNVTAPSLANDQLMAGSFQFQFDGLTGPTFTADAT